MNDKETREKVLKILQDALKEIDEIDDVDYHFIGMLSLFDSEGECADESTSWYEGTKQDITAAECLLEEIKEANKNNFTELIDIGMN
jgi:hypothetical protein